MAQMRTFDRHVRLVAQLPVGAAPPVIDIPFPPDWTKCDACKKTFPSSLSPNHDQSDRHLIRLRIFNYQNFLSRSESNQRGIEVQGSQDGINLGTHDHNLGAITPTTVLLTCSGQTPVSFLQARVSSSVGVQNLAGGQNYFLVTTATVQLPVSIEPQNSVAAQVQFNPQGRRGRFEDRLEFVFRDQGGTFVITRRVKAVVGNEDLDALAPITPYRRPPR
ncbi:unnamed protein product, partial [Rhizoctonia solani]